MKRRLFALFCCLGSFISLSAAPVVWVDWTSGTPGSAGTATGVLNIGGHSVGVTYSGEAVFIQTNGGTNFWIPADPYISPLVDNAPPDSDIIALSTSGLKTLRFDEAVDNLFFAIVSLNGNGYQFDSDFTIVSSGCGYWGCGGFEKVSVPGGFQVNSTGGEPHGVIRFNQPVQTITWTSLTDENWNGFTVGTYGLAPSAVPEPASFGLVGIVGLGLLLRRKLTA